MLSQILSAALHGVEATVVRVEVYLSPGMPKFFIVGQPDAMVREAKDRVVAAVRNSGFDYPVKRVTVNLSPADVKKEGSAFDLPIALGIIGAEGHLASNGGDLARYALVGELNLDGRVQPLRGLLPMALGVKAAGLAGLLFPKDNWAEASVVEGIDLVPIDNLAEAVRFFTAGERPAAPCEKTVVSLATQGGADLAEIKGQALAKRALEVAAAGGHNLLMVGPPGAGKTMLARRLTGLLPPLAFEEALEATKIHSVAGILEKGAFLSARPFRSPHHTVSDVALAGGGSVPRPGEVSLAHHGVLFLDELTEFSRSALEVLRQPLEEGFVTISRASGTETFPARVMLVAAMNPCPCGYLGHPDRACVCTPLQIHKYRAKISGPLLDRIDIHVEVPPLKIADLTRETPAAESTERVAARVHRARALQSARFEGTAARCNAHMGTRDVRRHCVLGPSGMKLLESAIEKLALSARSFDRILKVARTLADVAGEDKIQDHHVAEAVTYRCMDRLAVSA